MIIPVILSGGSGMRLWPLSRTLRPKQFLAIHTDKTLFQETLNRLDAIGLSDVMVLCNTDHRFLVAENARDTKGDVDKIILEPMARNTAPAVAVAAVIASQSEEDPILLVLPADHVIENINEFQKTVTAGEKLAQAGNLVTFGILPTKPHTGYGYIESGEPVDDDGYKVSNFKEKPNEKTAEEFIKQGNYFWNSGMFMFKASVFLEVLKQYAPDVVAGAEAAVADSHTDLDFIRLDEKAFATCPDISIDYAVMEKTDKAVVVKLEADWCDIGSWAALFDIGKKDFNGNVCRGDVMVEDTKDCYLSAPNRLVTAIGLENIVIVDTKDALLVADKNKTEILITQSRIRHLKSKNRAWL